MKRLIILTDGLADYPIKSLGNKTPVMAAHTPNMDKLAKGGATGLFNTVPGDLPPGSEVANLSIIGYDPEENFCRRGVLEAASMGIEISDTQLAIRCNLIFEENRKISSHSAGDLEHGEASEIIALLNEKLGTDRITFHQGIHYRHLLIIEGGNAKINCWPPHDHLGEKVEDLQVRALVPEAEETAALLNKLVDDSREVLSQVPWAVNRAKKGERAPTLIWPWAAGEKPKMKTMQELAGLKGATITAVDLIKGLGIYAGMVPIEVEGATGNWKTNYEGKAAATLKALETYDYVYLHVEAADEAGHDGDIDLKVKVINDIDSRLIDPVLKAIIASNMDIRIALLPDHPTPVELRCHVKDPVPVVLWGSGIEADSVSQFNEESVKDGSLGLLKQSDFFNLFFKN
jgi:2,3-bisphosphoglycerate-independent phosphoglycerate mutase